MADTTDTARAPLDYERVKAALEAELRHVNALLEIHAVVKDMQAWLAGDETSETTDGKEGA